MIRGGFAAAAALVLASIAPVANADPPLVEHMAGDLAGLVSGSIGRDGDEHAIVFQVAFVAAPTIVDGNLAAGPTIRLGGWAADGRPFYETRTLPADAFARLGSSWYLSIGDIPSLGQVAVELDELVVYPLPVNQAGVGSSTWSSGNDPVVLETVGRKHEALFAGRSSRAELRIEVDGVTVPMTHTFAYVGEHGSILSTPADVCYRHPTGAGCTTFP